MIKILKMGSRYQAKQQGGPFEIVSVSKPVPAADEVLIKVKAVALNPIDAKQLYVISHNFFAPPLQSFLILSPFWP